MIITYYIQILIIKSTISYLRNIQNTLLFFAMQRNHEEM